MTFLANYEESMTHLVLVCTHISNASKTYEAKRTIHSKTYILRIVPSILRNIKLTSKILFKAYRLTVL